MLQPRPRSALSAAVRYPGAWPAHLCRPQPRIDGKIGVGPDWPRINIVMPPSLAEELRRATRTTVSACRSARRRSRAHSDADRSHRGFIAADVNVDRTSTPDFSSFYAVVAQMAEDWATTGRARDKTGTPETECRARSARARQSRHPGWGGGVFQKENDSGNNPWHAPSIFRVRSLRPGRVFPSKNKQNSPLT